MITPLLESLILQGKARFKNWSFGYSQIGRIPVSDKDTAIITGFTYFPCMLKGQNLGVQHNHFMQFLQIEGDKSSNDYCIKNSIITSKFFDPVQQTIETIYSPGSPVKFDTYLVHNSDINLRLAIILDVAGDTINVAPPQPSANEPAPPAGFNGLNAVDTVQFANLGAPTIYNPMTKKLNPNNASNKDQMAVNFENPTLPDIGASVTDFDYIGIPVINFEIVFINKNFVNDIGSNK
jgi:hypothetical protein